MGQGRPIESKGRRFGGWARGARRPKACSPAPSTLLIWFAIAVVWIPPADGQDLDVTRESIRGIRKNVVWENLTHSKQFLRGVRPKRVVPTKPATVILGAGEGVEFLVPAHEMIQVVSVDGVQIDDGLTQIWTSDGSGLYRKLISAVSDRGCSILAAPNESGYSVAKVCRSESSIGQVRLAIYTSARPPTQTLDYYNCPILSTECVSISDDRGTRPRDYAFMESGRRAKFSMAGASRLRVEARLRFDLQSQRRQTYWIRVYVDGKLYRVVSMDTEPTGTRRQFVNGKERLIGRREFAYLDLDCGDKKVEIEVSHNCYLRIDGVGLDLCRPFLNRSFPYPTWQNVKSATTIWDASDWNTLAWESFDGTDAKLIHATGSADSGGSFAVDQKAPSGIWNPYLNQQRIQAIARDNSVRHGGLRAYMWVLACAARHVSDVRFGDEISLSEWCERIRNRYTQFMDTPIVQLPGNATFRRVAYVRRKVRSPQQDRTERIVGAQHLESSLASIGHVGLLDVTDDCSEPLRYRFPKTLGTSIVRLVVDPSKLTGNIRLWVRYDHRSPIEWMISPKDCLDKQRFVPTAAEAILSARKGTYGRYDQLTAGGPFAMSRENVATICASTAEIIKPAEVEEMEIWIESCHGGSQEQSIGIGVLHLDARKTRLSEKSYRYLADLVDCESEDAPTKAFARRELDNDALQLESELRSHHRGIRESVRQHPIVNPAQDPWDQATIDSQQMLIKELIEKAPPGGTNWPAIIELLSDLIRNADGQAKYDAVLARVDALQSSGESYLAEMELRGWLVFCRDESFRNVLFERLMQDAQDDRAKQIRYLAFAAIEWQDSSLEQRLARTLADSSRYRDALILQSTLDSNAETEDLLLRCSLLAGWWATFDQTLDRVRDPAKKNLWMGLKQWRLGFVDHAKRTLKAGADAGRKWLAYGTEAEQILEGLTKSDEMTRYEAVTRWEDWQRRHPGAMRWRTSPGAVRQAAGREQVVSAERGTRSTYFVASPEHHGKIVVQGPARLKLLVRPIHAPATLEEPGHRLNDWLHLVSGGASTLVPITENGVSLGQQSASRSFAVGQRVESIIALPEGRHQFGIHCQNNACLFQVSLERPELALPILPSVNATTMGQVAANRFGIVPFHCQKAGLDHECRDCVRVFRRDQTCLTVPICYVASPCDCNRCESLADAHDPLPAGAFSAFHERVVPIDQPILIEGRSQELDAAIAITHQSELDAQSSLRGSKDFAVDPRLLGLVRIGESQRPESDDIRILRRRLKSGSSWELYRQFDSRAGIHSVKLERWSPETPAVRIRKQLMPNSSARYALSDRSRLKLEINDEKPTTFEFRLVQPSVGFLSVPAASAILETRSRTMSVVCGEPDVVEEMQVEMPAGRGTIGLTLPQRVSNQFVLADVLEIDPSGKRLPIDHGQLRRVLDRRNYHVATHDRPLVVRVAGPSIFRIDRYFDGITSSETVRTLDDHVFSFAPSPDKGPALYRVFELRFPHASEPASHSDRVPGPNANDPVEFRLSDEQFSDDSNWQTTPARGTALLQSRWQNHGEVSDVGYRPWDPSRFDRSASIVQAAYHEIDHPESLAAIDSLSLRSGDLMPLAVRFDRWVRPQNRMPGTTRLGVRFRSRFAEQEIPQPIVGDEFWEFKASRLRHHRWNDHFTETDLLARTRESGAPTFGIDHRGTKEFAIDYCDPFANADGWGPVRLNYRGYVMGQFDVPTISQSDAPSDLWTAGFRAGIARRHHFSSILSERWNASIFARSVRENAIGYLPGSIDQDIFTRYKSDHPFGLRFSHQLLYQQNLDSRWWLGPGLVTNSDQWVPDYVNLHVGTDQLIGPLQIRLSYRLTGYFADNDRRKSALQNVVYADLMFVHEHGRDNWSEWSLSVRSDLSNQNTSLGMQYVLYFNDGRGLRDFRPGSLVFRNLRDERAARRYLFEL